ncbi:MAG: hypothetical protein WDA20_08050 [Desulfuromonadales bacterium]
MAEKIGEVLIQEGLITQTDLEEALKSQVIYGGKLGTNLIEMGFLSEEDFGRVLSKMLRVPYVGAHELRDIPPEVIAALPADLAEKYKVVPLRLESRRLTLVMADPTDLRVIDDISFRTGFLIRPLITSELGLEHTLEKYYDIAREVRYISLGRTVPTPRKPAVSPTPPAALKRTPGISPVAQPTSAAADTAAPAPLAAGAAASSPAVSPPQPIDIFEEILAADSTPVGLEKVAQKLTLATDREDIAAAAIGWLGSQFPRSALFLVRGEFATGWHAFAAGTMVDGFDRLRIPLAEPSVLKTVTNSRSPVLGPLQRTPFNSEMLQALGGELPKTVLLLPLMMLGRVMAVLYLDGADALLQEKMPEVQKLCAKMIMAFEILVLKNKILQL